MSIHQRTGIREGVSPPVRRNPVPIRPNIRALKDAVGIGQVAGDYGRFRPSGAGRLQGRCVSPDHEDRTPSMTIYAAEGRFKCFGCGAHGDVIDLVVLVEGCELHEALLILSQRHGVELPGRPDSWRRKQERQGPVRDTIAQARFEHQKRRLFRVFFAPSLVLIEDEAEREEETAALWEATDYLARMMRDRRSA